MLAWANREREIEISPISDFGTGYKAVMRFTVQLIYIRNKGLLLSIGRTVNRYFGGETNV
jgi:hypothetical protein